jgi:alpha-glucoside transport system substrate-binding protein
MSRRPVFSRVAATAVLLATIAGSSACAAPRPTRPVTVLGVWEDEEAARFERVLDEFRARSGIEVHYQGKRAFAQVLLSDVSRGRPPDVVVMPDVGGLRRHIDRLEPLDSVVRPEVWAQYPRQWRGLMRLGRDQRYAVPINATLKSMIWHRQEPQTAPRTLDELLALGSAETTSPWCVGLASTGDPGWPGTDWIEDLVLHRSGRGIYEQWAAGQVPWNGDELRAAWTTWDSIVAGPITDEKSRIRALLTDFNDARKPSAGAAPGVPGCRFEHQASFALGSYRELGIEPAFLPFPGPDPSSPVWEVSADLAALFSGRDEAKALINFLASSEAQRIWVAGGGFSANASREVNAAYGDDRLRHDIARHLTGDDVLCFDASDVMPPQLRDTFQRTILAHLAEPARLNELLGQLDGVRRSMRAEDWLDTVCVG